MLNNEIRRFEKVDWYGWAGSEKFSNGHQPFIYHKDINDEADVTLIGDANGVGISVYIEGEDHEYSSLNWYFEKKMPEMVVLGHMQAMIEEFELDKVVDTATLCYKLDTTKTWNFEFAEG